MLRQNLVLKEADISKDGWPEAMFPNNVKLHQTRVLNTCKVKLEDVSGHEHDQHRTRRQLLIPSPLQTNDTEPCGSWPKPPESSPQHTSALQCVSESRETEPCGSPLGVSSVARNQSQMKGRTDGLVEKRCLSRNRKLYIGLVGKTRSGCKIPVATRALVRQCTLAAVVRDTKVATRHQGTRLALRKVKMLTALQVETLRRWSSHKQSWLLGWNRRHLCVLEQAFTGGPLQKQGSPTPQLHVLLSHKGLLHM